MTQIERIKAMEARKNRCEAAVAALEAALEEYNAAQNDLQKLAAYYSGPNWWKDFDADEAGRLPKDLPRGVLSEDGVFDLLEANRAVQIELAKTVTAIIKAGLV
ncbi:MAG: DUF4298 domain-containing protein [Lachnospiraceae bacterium]|nr:DUF4298 domain-containing protein [Lachnospiraceae bacterium]